MQWLKMRGPRFLLGPQNRKRTEIEREKRKNTEEN